MVLIRDLQRRGALDRHALEEFLSSHSFPLVEGRTVTFVYRGHADEVHLQHWIYGLQSSQEFERLPGTDVWFHVMDLPEGSRVEYKFAVVQRGRGQLIRDPLNPNLAHDPYGANSVVHAEGYEVPDWIDEDPDARHGELQQHELDTVDFGRRGIQVYLPARFRESRRYPLLVVHDGSDYLRFASLKNVLDNLIHRLEIPPMVVALVDSQNRLQEYADDPRHADFLADDLVPWMEEQFPLVGSPQTRGMLGSSFGAVASLSAAWRRPGVFGNLALLSGSFAFTDIGQDHERGPAFDPVVEFVNAFREEPGTPAEKVYLACGTYESLIYFNRSMLPLLQSTGMAVKYQEARDGHNWENWRDRLREGLSWLFPGPLWMVYE